MLITSGNYRVELEFPYILGRQSASGIKSSSQNFICVLKILQHQVKRHRIVDDFFHRLALSSTHGYHSLYTCPKWRLDYSFFYCKELFIGHNPVMWCLVWTLIRVNRLWKIVKHRQEETNNQLLIIQKSQCQLHDILKDVYPSNFFSLKLEAIVMALISKSFYV